MISESAQNSGILTCSEMRDINSISDISAGFLTIANNENTGAGIFRWVLPTTAF